MFELRAKSTSEADVLMYGSVSEWGRVSAIDFINKLTDAKSKGYLKVNAKINCPGGSIFEGLAIMSQMGSQGVYVTGIVEGIAASMGTLILMSCHKRVMVRGTRIMIHQGSGGVMGQVNEIRDYADLLESLNKTLAEIIAKRSKKKDVKWVQENWMAAGKDKWFTAEEALAEGLIDEIIEGNVKPLEKENASFTEMAAHYSQFTKIETENEMNKEQLIALLGLKADASEAEITAAIKAYKEKAEKAEKTEKPETPKPELKAEAGDDNAIMLIEAMAKDRGVTDEKKLAAIKKMAKVDVKAAMDLLPDKAEATVATTTEAKAETPKPLTITELLNVMKSEGGASAKGDSSTWGWDEWNKPENAKAFTELLKNDYKKYVAVFKAKFNYEPTEAELKAL